MLEGFSKHNSSVNGSHDESDGESHIPLPQIKINPGLAKEKKSYNTNKKKVDQLKGGQSQRTFGYKALKSKKKLNEDQRNEKGRLFKKAFLDCQKIYSKKSYPYAS